MIKGKTLIELTDVKTGKVERYEDENMLTNAIDLYINMAAAWCAKKSDYFNKINTLPCFPISDGIIGGIKLFGSTIEENANNYAMPNLADNPVVGYASIDASAGTDPKRGSRNIAETTALENGMQIVWDFATSEANGAISCVCLTSRLGGTAWYRDIYAFESVAKINKEFIGIPVSFDKETNILTTMSYSGPLTFRKYKLEITNLSLDATPYTFNLIDEQVKEGTNTSYLWRDSGAGFYYYVSYASTSGNTTTIKYQKMDKTTFATSEVTVTVSGISVESRSKSNYAIKDGYLYVPASTHNKIYKIDLSNTSNIVTIDLQAWGTVSTNNLHICPLENNLLLTNGIICDSRGGGFVVIDPDFNLDKQYFYGMSVGINYGGGLYNCFEGNGFRIYDVDYNDENSTRRLNIELDHTMLMSINNLETPVTKTADKTMKITYTLTYTN